MLGSQSGKSETGWIGGRFAVEFLISKGPGIVKETAHAACWSLMQDNKCCKLAVACGHNLATFHTYIDTLQLHR